MAIGILMDRHRFTRQEAFDVLKVASQNSNRKLADIAVEVADTGILTIDQMSRNHQLPLSQDFVAGASEIRHLRHDHRRRRSHAVLCPASRVRGDSLSGVSSMSKRPVRLSATRIRVRDHGGFRMVSPPLMRACTSMRAASPVASMNGTSVKSTTSWRPSALAPARRSCIRSPVCVVASHAPNRRSTSRQASGTGSVRRLRFTVPRLTSELIRPPGTRAAEGFRLSDQDTRDTQGCACIESTCMARTNANAA